MLQSQYTKNTIEAGLDEVGRGCLAGPVVAAAVILPDNFFHPLLNDSKKLKEKEKNQLEIIIKEKALAWSIAEASHQEVDQYNVLKATFLAMHRAIDSLRLRPELLLIDGNRFAPYPFISHQCIVKGDSKLASIAAASILAKTYRDKQMKELALQFHQYGWQTNVGYPTSEHTSAIAKYGLSPWHRKTFKYS